MKMAYITLFAALAVASVAAWFAIIGVVAMFGAKPIHALIMGVTIEGGKLVLASWLKWNWNKNTFLKWFATFLTAVAMFLTSMGIFGFLSKAHIEQGAAVGDNAASIERLDQRMAIQQRAIDDALLVMSQLDDAVNTLIEYDRIRGPSGSLAVREGQKEERDKLNAIISDAQKNIDMLSDEKFELSREVREFELEVGPILYIADLFFDDPSSHLDDAMKIVIILFMFVLDPMAIALLLIANTEFERGSKRKETMISPPEEQKPDLQNMISSATDEEGMSDIPPIEDKPESKETHSNNFRHHSITSSTATGTLGGQAANKSSKWISSNKNT